LRTTNNNIPAEQSVGKDKNKGTGIFCPSLYFYTDIVYLHLPHQNQTEYFPKNIPFMMQKACFYTVKGGIS